MTQSLFTGASGLRAFQQQLDVVANNLANLNTTSFKSQNVTFSDLIYRNQRSAAGADGDSFGGINPAQVGSGVQVSQINRSFEQGALQETGEPLDFAIRGSGFFVLSNGSDADVYTRAGSFSLDGNGDLVDPATGLLVQRTGSVGESSTDGIGFQTAGDNRINIPLGAPIPGQETSNLSIAGNLPSSALPPQREVLSSLSPLETATGAANLTTLFSDLSANQSAYEPGDTIEILGTNVDGTPFDFTLPADTASVGDLLDNLNLLLDGATAELNGNGDFELVADETGEAFLSLLIRDASSNANSSDFAAHALTVTTEGGAGDVFENVVQVFDVQGNAQNLQLSFRKGSQNSWDVIASIPDSDGRVVDELPFSVSFSDDGLNSFVQSGNEDNSLTLQLDSLSSLQTIEIDFGDITQTGTGFGLSPEQDGFPPGVLADVALTGSGQISGIGTNGVQVPIAQLAIAGFSNVEGLEAVGNNYFQSSTNSGVTLVGEGQSNGLGSVIGSQLETSNVDITDEFTKLVIAQRAFSANARTITVAEEVLEELTNLVR